MSSGTAAPKAGIQLGYRLCPEQSCRDWQQRAPEDVLGSHPSLLPGLRPGWKWAFCGFDPNQQGFTLLYS